MAELSEAHYGVAFFMKALINGSTYIEASDKNTHKRTNYLLFQNSVGNFFEILSGSQILKN